MVGDGDMKFLRKLYAKLHTEKSLDEDRLAFLACIVKDCKHNGLGDITITIKLSGNKFVPEMQNFLKWKYTSTLIFMLDQSGTAKASVHKKVVQDGQFGPNIGIGSVMLLQDVLS